MFRARHSLVFLSVAASALSFSSAHAANEPVSPTDSILDLEMTPEEHLSTGAALPSTPESGNENAEDLLTSPPESTASSTLALPEDLPPSDEEAPPAQSVYHDRSIPPQDRENPNWAVDVHGFVFAFSNEDTRVIGGRETSVGLKNVGVGFEWQPSFIQNANAGVISVGPSANLYIADDTTPSRFSIYSLGLTLKYQFRYARNQIVIPFIGGEVQQIKYRFNDESELGNGYTMAAGPAAGLLINLNWFEPPAAHTFFSEDGVRRSYLLVEVKRLSTQQEALASLQNALYFGLRMEF